MNRLQTAVVLLMLTIASTVIAQKSQPTSQSIKPEEVKLTTDPDDVEFCKERSVRDSERVVRRHLLLAKWIGVC